MREYRGCYGKIQKKRGRPPGAPDGGRLKEGRGRERKEREGGEGGCSKRGIRNGQRVKGEKRKKRAGSGGGRRAADGGHRREGQGERGEENGRGSAQRVGGRRAVRAGRRRGLRKSTRGRSSAKLTRIPNFLLLNIFDQRIST